VAADDATHLVPRRNVLNEKCSQAILMPLGNLQMKSYFTCTLIVRFVITVSHRYSGTGQHVGRPRRLV